MDVPPDRVAGPEANGLGVVSVIPSRGSAVLAVDLGDGLVGSGYNKYVRASIDGSPVATSPLASLPAALSTQSEIPSSLETSRPVGIGPHTVGLEVFIASGSSCAIERDLWHLEVDVVAAEGEDPLERLHRSEDLPARYLRLA